jgi:hypothetical protein
LVKKFPGEKRSVRWCVVVKVRGEVITNFHIATKERRSSMRNWLFGLPVRILCEKSPWWLFVCPWLCSSSVSPFSISMSLDVPCTAHASLPERLFNHCQGLHRTFSETCTQFDAVRLSDPPWNRIRPNTRLKIKGRKKSTSPPS